MTIISPQRSSGQIPSSTVTFNVGGAFFTTSRTTLQKEQTSRLSLIVKGTIPCVKDAQGVIFIDRDPKNFQLILNFLRDGWCLLPSSPEQRQELSHEVRFYQLNSFETWIRSQETSMAPPTANDVMRNSATRISYPSIPVRGVGSPPPDLSGTFTVPSTLTGGSFHSVGSYRVAGSSNTAGGLASGRVNSPSSYRPYSPTIPVSPPPRMQQASVANSGRESIRQVFLQATQAGPSANASPAYSLPHQPDSDKWTTKYLSTNDELRNVVDTLLELAFVHPHSSMHAGKTCVTISSACNHDQAASLLGGMREQMKNKIQVVKSTGAAGWSFEFPIRPGGDPTLFEKYNIVEYVQDNWFVLLAILKDQFGVLLEEEVRKRPDCVACRRTNMAVLLTKIT